MDHGDFNKTWARAQRHTAAPRRSFQYERIVGRQGEARKWGNLGHPRGAMGTMNPGHGPPVTHAAAIALRASVGFRIVRDVIVIFSLRPMSPGRRPRMTQDPRLATRDDLQAVEAVVRAAYGHYVARLGRKPGPMLDDYGALIERGLVHVLDHDGRVQGVLVLIPEARDMLLDNVAVVPEARGLGLGRGMLAFAERAAIALGYRSIRLYTNEAMTENISLYSRVGYVETHRAEEKGLRRVYMSKPLA